MFFVEINGYFQRICSYLIFINLHNTFIPNGYSYHRNRNLFSCSIQHLHDYPLSTSVQFGEDISPIMLCHLMRGMDVGMHDRRHFYWKIKEEEQEMSSAVARTLLAIHRILLFCFTFQYISDERNSYCCVGSPRHIIKLEQYRKD